QDARVTTDPRTFAGRLYSAPTRVPAAPTPALLARTPSCGGNKNVDRSFKTLVVLALAIVANGAGNLSLSYGMKSVGPPEAWTPAGLWDVVGTALSTAPVIAGVLLLLIFFA